MYNSAGDPDVFEKMPKYTVTFEEMCVTSKMLPFNGVIGALNVSLSVNNT